MWLQCYIILGGSHRHMSLQNCLPGVSYKDCFEKDELVKRLATVKTRKQPVTRQLDKDKVIVRIPMRKLKSTMSSPKEYIIIPMTFGNRGTFDFLLDTGSSTTIVSPSLAHNKLGIIPGSGQISRGLGGMGDGGLDLHEVSLPAVTIAGHLCQPIKVKPCNSLQHLSFFLHFSITNILYILH